jgi:hypothetical protein
MIGNQKCVVDVPKISFNPKVKDWIVAPDPGTHELKITKNKSKGAGNMVTVSAIVVARPEHVPEKDEWDERLKAHIEPEVVRLEREKLIKKIREDTKKNKEMTSEIGDHLDTIKIMMEDIE